MQPQHQALRLSSEDGVWRGSSRNATPRHDQATATLRRYAQHQRQEPGRPWSTVEQGRSFTCDLEIIPKKLVGVVKMLSKTTSQKEFARQLRLSVRLPWFPRWNSGWTGNEPTTVTSAKDITANFYFACHRTLISAFLGHISWESRCTDLRFTTFWSRDSGTTALLCCNTNDCQNFNCQWRN